MTELLDLAALRRAPLARVPFDHVVVRELVRPEARGAILADFPPITQTGSLPVAALSYGPGFGGLLRELDGPDLAGALSEKFGIDLSTYPTLVTVRGRSGADDGFVHTDSSWKVVSLLIYLNDDWGAPGGRLRLLRSRDLEDWAVEVPPDWGTAVIFRRSECSYHGHKPYTGPRRVIQVNWATSAAKCRQEIGRHRRALLLKRIVPTVNWRSLVRGLRDRGGR